MTSWHSPQKIHSIGHNLITGIFENEVLIEEKVDGSFFAFGIFNGKLKVRSKGVEINPVDLGGMFAKAVETVKSIQHLLTDGFTYRGEYLSKPKHNTLAYDRNPNKHIILFDICSAEEVYLSYTDKVAEANRLGLEVVPVIYQGKVESPNTLLALLDTISVLGGQKIEGIVIKNYTKFGVDHKAMFGKYVSEAFKEIHGKDWKDRNPSRQDVVQVLGDSLRTPARWHKSIQHLKEKGLLTNSPKDIGLLMKEVKEDITIEAQDHIKTELYNYFIRDILGITVKGLPEFYKEELLKNSFKE